ncbi:MAG: EamA family transporter [Armatimonadetes bacterium]|nr:EamA family transporter [Armatimonadota bacterium]MDE2206930.1 EamA family transporter [Armatimonadota bacterium]
MVLLACVAHAAWNLVCKRSGRTVAFFWLANMFVLVAASPCLAVIPAARRLPPADIWLILLVTGIFQSLYFAFLMAAYQLGDVSIVYPVARLSPLFVVPAAGMILHTWPQPIGFVGVVAVSLGCLLLASPRAGARNAPPQHRRTVRAALLIAVATAIWSAGYTVTDDIGMHRMSRVYGVSPAALLYGYLEWVSTTIFLTALVWIREGLPSMRATWKSSGRAAWQVALLQFGGYVLVLWAYAASQQVAYVAAMRQFSVIMGVVGGMVFLGEPRRPVRLAAAAVITAGLTVIVTAR